MVEKRDLVLQKKSSKRTHLLLIAGILVLAAVAIFSFANVNKQTVAPLPYATILAPQNYQQQLVAQTPVQAVVTGGTIQIPLQAIEANKFIITTYAGGGRSLKLTSYIAPSGKVITAVSICEPCRSETFHIAGNQLVCNACGTKWDLETLKGISGGCLNYPPDVLESTLENGNIVIAESLVANWQPRV